MLKASDIRKQYGDLHVLKGVNLEVDRGEVVSIVGASGAGKSTLLHILGTLDSPDSGSLLIGGQEAGQLRDKELAKFRNRHIGFVFQFHNLLPEFTAFENVCIPGYLGDRPEKEVRDRANELLDQLGVTSRATHKPSQMSGGEQQRVSVARALINSPDIVFADEPSGNLDSKNAAELHSIFFDLRNTLGQSFVIVTHNTELAAMADRCFTIQDGIILS